MYPPTFFLRTVIALGMTCAFRAGAAPEVRNGSFELDRFTKTPGLAIPNNGIRAWKCRGNVGINPLQSEGADAVPALRPFLDNGRIPDGRQTAFIQNIGVLRQQVKGFRVGASYVVRYFENARRHRRTRRWPRLAVLVGEKVVVPDHGVRPVDAVDQFEKPYRAVVSAPFTVQSTTPQALVFLTSVGGGVTVYIDAVRIEEVSPSTRVAPTFPLEVAPPVVLNGSFEADHYTRRPGYAATNGGITAWRSEGSAGVNPTWTDPLRDWGEKHDFTDNGRIPDGRQAAFIQGKGALRQTVLGFQAGRRYRVRYFENARVTRAVKDDPVVTVRLGGDVVVSAHSVPALDPARRHETPYYRVRSAVFAPLRSGAYELVFEALSTGSTTVLLDGVTVEEVP
ncbi:MAG: hypothetical protein GXP31_12775 [Kiritimatiellaeota bacterium]|nr:hypothetical protein [Kiritimatiellota bacterium]